MSLDPGQRASLLGAKLRALATDLGVSCVADPVDLAGGSAIVEADTVVALAGEHTSERALGQVLLLAAHSEAAHIVLFFDDASTASVAARRAAVLAPLPEVRVVVGAGSEAAEPAPLLQPVEPPPAPDGFDDLCRGAGVDPVVEHGIWRGEVLGLEVLRATDSGFETGVGRFDREASSLLHGDLPTTESLAAAADQVRARRREGAAAHPLATLARERWLRHDLQAHPGLIGLSDLTAVDPAVERAGLRAPAPAPAMGTATNGERVLVVCSAGVDTDLVPATADLVLRERPDRVLVVVPPGDILPPVEQVVARLAVPATIVGVEGGWA